MNDKNTLIGLLLIGIILLVYSYLMQKEQQEESVSVSKKDTLENVITSVKNNKDSVKTISQDSINRNIVNNQKYGYFSNSSTGKNKIYVLENNLMKVFISTKGGRIISVELKKYKTYDKKPLKLFDKNSFNFNYEFFTTDNKIINTSDLYFSTTSKDSIIKADKQNNSNTLSLRLYDNSKKSYLEFIYTINYNKYDIGYTFNIVGFSNIVSKNSSDFSLAIHQKVRQLEKSFSNERNNTTIYYKYKEDEPDYISERKDDKENFVASISWIAFKQQFFSAIFIADNGFDKLNSYIKTSTPESEDYIKDLFANLTIPYNLKANEKFNMHIYFGPNHYKTLASYDKSLEKLIPLGWGIFGWINRILVIPVFNLLSKTNLNYGIVILLLTIFIKILLFPITYKTYLSAAKMRVLKPEIDKINKKFSKADPLKKQQAIMSLYKQTGVNPLSGCIPQLIQFPILIAMFKFFPASIELRQQSFLWADDLSSYDSILQLPFNIPFYGNHVSLFTLLMALSSYLYTFITNQNTAQDSQMAQMKVMMYIFPAMLLIWFNNYSSGLSLYYFLANIITITQMFVIKKFFIDEKEILKKIEVRRKKAEKTGIKKSKFQQRLEEIAKKRGYNLPNK